MVPEMFLHTAEPERSVNICFQNQAHDLVAALARPAPRPRHPRRVTARRASLRERAAADDPSELARSGPQVRCRVVAGPVRSAEARRGESRRGELSISMLSLISLSFLAMHENRPSS